MRNASYLKSDKTREWQKSKRYLASDGRHGRQALTRTPVPDELAERILQIVESASAVHSTHFGFTPFLAEVVHPPHLNPSTTLQQYA